MAAAMVRHATEIGRSRKIQNSPYDRIRDLCRLFSIIGPSTKAALRIPGGDAEHR
jgi:hypothetical protein